VRRVPHQASSNRTVAFKRWTADEEVMVLTRTSSLPGVGGVVKTVRVQRGRLVTAHPVSTSRSQSPRFSVGSLAVAACFEDHPTMSRALSKEVLACRGSLEASRVCAGMGEVRIGSASDGGIVHKLRLLVVLS
jgi:hypothetical protein